MSPGRQRFYRFVLLGCLVSLLSVRHAWTQSAADVEAKGLVGALTVDEKLSLVQGDFPVMIQPLPAGLIRSAGFIPGVARLGIPPLKETDASLGVANAGRPAADEVSLPSGLAIAASFDEAIAFEGERMVGREARAKGFNVLLGGGVNLVRDPRNGRNFEYLGEDPLLAGRMAGAAIAGAQSNHIISTIKHFALNAQESGRHVLDASIDPAALRESDLLAFEIAIEKGQPGAVMCAYNKVNGVYACENADLFSALKNDWGYKGFVMSDWGAVHSTASAVNAGLDQQSGRQLDHADYFGADLKKALAAGEVKTQRLDDMVRRILWAQVSTGVLDRQTPEARGDHNADLAVSQRAAEAGIVLLKNTNGVLPLARKARSILVVGGRADVGVLSGGGSSQVIPQGSLAAPAEGKAPGFVTSTIYHPSSPFAALQARMPGAKIQYTDGSDPVRLQELARKSDLVVVFARQWTTEGADAAMALRDDDAASIDAATAANNHVVVVLETGGPVKMPWLPKVQGVIEAWYSGSAGGEAITRVLVGDVNPSGRLPVTFPVDESQLPRPVLDGGSAPAEGASGGSDPAPFSVHYTEGADVGYRWFEKTNRKPLFPFGYGLSYARFRTDHLRTESAAALKLRFRVTNISNRTGVDTPQIYIKPPTGQARLVGWRKVSLKPHQSRQIEMVIDPRILSTFDVGAKHWVQAPGLYELRLAENARSVSQKALVALPLVVTPP